MLDKSFTLFNLDFSGFNFKDFALHILKKEKEKGITSEEDLLAHFQDICDEIKKLPSEKRAQLQGVYKSIFASAFEHSFTHIDSVELRKMFAQLLVSTVNMDKQKYVHSAYDPIIAQLTPLDSKILALFRPKSNIFISMGLIVETFDGRTNTTDVQKVEPDKSSIAGHEYLETVMPIGKFWLVDKRRNTQISLLSNAFVEYDDTTDLQIIAACIDNLCRLGLLETNYSKTADEESYKKFYKHKYYIINEKTLVNNPANNHPGFTFIRGNQVPTNSFDSILLEKGIIRLTEFGFNFTQACMIKEQSVLYPHVRDIEK